MKRENTFLYLVDWGTGFVGGFDKDFVQVFNTPTKMLFEDLRIYDVQDFKIITPDKLDELRGYHRVTL